MAAVITLEEVARRTRIPIATLRYWRSTGGGPRTFRLGRRVMAYESDIDSWIEDQASKDQSRQRLRQ